MSSAISKDMPRLQLFLFRSPVPADNGRRSGALRKFALACLGMLAGGQAFADCYTDRCTSVYVDELYVEATGGLWLQTSGTESSLTCAVNSGVWLRLEPTAAGFKYIYGTLLAAQLAERTVTVRIDSGSNPCSISYVVVSRSS
jgi:hypothetical protein